MTRLISNSTRSNWAASTDGGTGAPVFSIDVLAALLTGLPGQGRSPPPAEGCRGRGGLPAPRASVLHLSEAGTEAPDGVLRRPLKCCGTASTPLPAGTTDC